MKNLLLTASLLLVATSLVRTQPSLVALPADLAFSCDGRLSGFFADPLYDCQVFHICVDGKKHGSMLCPVGTAFSQRLFTCTWAVDSDCVNAELNYPLNGRLYFQDQDPAVREAVQSREQVSPVDVPGKSLDPAKIVLEDPSKPFRKSQRLSRTDDSKQLQTPTPKFVNDFDDTSNDINDDINDDVNYFDDTHYDIDDVPTSSEEPIFVPPIEFALPVRDTARGDEEELLRVAENVLHIGDILLPLPKEGRSLFTRNEIRSLNENVPSIADYLPPVLDPVLPTDDHLPPIQDPIPPTDDYFPPVQDPIPPTDDYLPPVQDPIPPTDDYLPPVQDPIPPTDDYLPPVQDPIPPTDDFLPPVQDPIPPTDDYLPPVQNPIPPTNDYLLPSET